MSKNTDYVITFFRGVKHPEFEPFTLTAKDSETAVILMAALRRAGYVAQNISNEKHPADADLGSMSVTVRLFNKTLDELIAKNKFERLGPV